MSVVTKDHSQGGPPEPPPAPDLMRVLFEWVVAALVINGMALRVVLWWLSVGSNDVHIWSTHAAYILKYGLATTYVNVPIYNHPPLMGWYAAFASWIGQGDLLMFARWFKLPFLLADLVSIMLLWRFAGPAATVIYACAPAAFLIGAFHGNSDALCAAAILGGAIALDRKHWFTSGTLFAVAINVKLIPLALLPIVFVALQDWRAFRRMAGGLAPGILPFAPLAVSVGKAMRRNMLEYVPSPENWGLMAFLMPASKIQRIAPTFDPIRMWYFAHGSAIIIVAVIALALIWRFWLEAPPSHGIALGIAAFLVFTPGFGIQYLIYATLLLCFVHRSAAIAWAVTSGAFASLVYWIFLDRITPPYQSIFTSNFPEPAPIIGAFAWAALVWYMVDEVRMVRSQTRQGAIAETAAQPSVASLSVKIVAAAVVLTPFFLLLGRVQDKPLNEPLKSFEQVITSSVRVLRLHPHQKESVPVVLRNPGRETWVSAGRCPVVVSYKWYGHDGLLPIEGERTSLPVAIRPEGIAAIKVNIQAPPQNGDFRLRITLVQEGVAWFMSVSNRFLEIPVSVD